MVATASIGIGLLALLGPAPALGQSDASSTQLDRIVAVVNEDVIVLSELEARLQSVLDQLQQSHTNPPPPGVLERQVLDRLIIDRLQLQLAEQTGLRIDDRRLNDSVAAIASQNGLSLREFRDILERDGYDFAKFREQIREQLLINQVQQRNVTDRITVSDRDIENFFATQQVQGGRSSQYHLGHILIALPEGAAPEEIAAARNEAAQVVAELESGADFARMAIERSHGQQALEGGDLGWRKTEELPTIFADIVPQMSVGEVSDPIRSPSGFHIIKLLETRGEGRHVVTLTHVRHILIRTDELTSDEDAAAELQGLRERIENGEDFAVLARASSDDAANAAAGGDLGWVNPADMVPAFVDVMDATGVGDVSRPFETQFGWHILQVLGRKEHDDTEEVRRAKAIEQIRNRKVQEELQSWLRQLRDEAYVEYRLDE